MASKSKPFIEDIKTVKERFEDLKIVANGTSLAINIPSRFIKKAELNKGDAVTVTIEATKVYFDEAVSERLKELYEDLCKEVPGFDQFRIGDYITYVMVLGSGTRLAAYEERIKKNGSPEQLEHLDKYKLLSELLKTHKEAYQRVLQRNVL